MAMTFRPSKQALKSLLKIKRDHGINTNSKALEFVLRQFPILQEKLHKACMGLEKTNLDLSTMKQIILEKAVSDLNYKNMIDKLIP